MGGPDSRCSGCRHRTHGCCGCRRCRARPSGTSRTRRPRSSRSSSVDPRVYGRKKRLDRFVVEGYRKRQRLAPRRRRYSLSTPRAAARSRAGVVRPDCLPYVRHRVWNKGTGGRVCAGDSVEPSVAGKDHDSRSESLCSSPDCRGSRQSDPILSSHRRSSARPHRTCTAGLVLLGAAT
jgi:hypothetical protein